MKYKNPEKQISKSKDKKERYILGAKITPAADPRIKKNRE